ncbi:oligosaccharide flippase family protein [Spongorhabdus nitratireducens]
MLSTSIKKLKTHSVTKNAVALLFMQISNTIIPFIVYPYLTRHLGIDEFSNFALVMALIQLSFVITDYGFSLSGAYEIATNQNNKSHISHYLASVFIVKSLMTFVSLMLFGLYLKYYSNIENTMPLFLGGTLAIVGQAYQWTWFFQGIEKMKNVTIYHFFVRLLFVLLVFYLVDEKGDGFLAIYAWGFAQVFGAILSFYMIYTKGFYFSSPTKENIIGCFTKGWHFFFSRVSVSLYTTANIVILGLTGSSTYIAHYSICDQLYKGGQAITSPLSQAMYPYMARTKDWNFFYYAITFTGISLAVICLLFSLFSEEFLVLLYGDSLKNAGSLFDIFLIITIINFFGSAFGYSAASAIGKINIANHSVIIGSLIHLSVVALLYALDRITPYTLAFSLLTAELFVMMIRIFLIRYHYKISNSLS